MQEFNARGVRFSYPDSWTVVDDSTEESLQVTVQSPESAFWTLALLPGSPSLEAILASVETAYREDYPQADIYPATDIDGPHGPALLGRAEFVCLDLIVNATAQAFQVGDQSVLVLTQAADVEADTIGPVFEAMTTSLRIENESVWPSDRPGI